MGASLQGMPMPTKVGRWQAFIKNHTNEILDCGKLFYRVVWAQDQVPRS